MADRRVELGAVQLVAIDRNLCDGPSRGSEYVPIPLVGVAGQRSRNRPR